MAKDPTPQPYTTLQPFSRFAGTNGPAKAEIAAGVHRQRTQERPGFDPYQPVPNAIRGGFAWGDTTARLESAIEKARPAFKGKFRECLDGWEHHCSSEPIRELGPVRGSTWSASGLTITVNPHIQLMREESEAHEVVRFWMTDDEPSAMTVEAALGLMALTVDQFCPGARPALLDLRRGRIYRDRLYTDRKLIRWLTAEAAAFILPWRDAA